jgi:YHS domain-containing protein
MMKKTFSIAILLLLAVGAAFASDDRHEGNQTKCPVLGNDVNKSVYTDYQGNRIYFCCAGCIDAFNEDPQAYLQKMKDEGVELLKLNPQSVCPVSGKNLTNKDVYSDYESRRVYFCCNSCKAAFEKDPAKYLKVLSDRGEAPEQLPEQSESESK